MSIKKQIQKSNKTFTFQNISTHKVASIVKKLNTRKTSKCDDIPTKVIQARRNEKNSGGGWEFIEKCWPSWLAGSKDRSFEIV